MMHVVKAQRLVSPAEDTAQGEHMRPARRRELREMRRLEIKLKHSLAPMDLYSRLLGLQQHQREHSSPRPRRQLVHVQRKPIRQQSELDRSAAVACHGTWFIAAR